MGPRGIFPPIPTPFHQDESIAFDHLKKNVNKWNEQPLDGLVVGGSNGEFIYLTLLERVRVVEAVRESLASDRMLIAGSGMESTRQTIQLTDSMTRAGADFALVITPSYYTNKMNSRALVKHYKTVADRSSIPVLIYNVPANTGIDLPLDAALQLAEHPNIVGMKDSSGNVARMAEVVGSAPEDFSMLAGSGGYFLPALGVGAVGVIAALANIAANNLSRILEAFHNGDLASARREQALLVPLNRSVTAEFGVAGLKAALDLLGYYGGPVRKPLLPISKHEQELLASQLAQTGL